MRGAPAQPCHILDLNCPSADTVPSQALFAQKVGTMTVWGVGHFRVQATVLAKLMVLYLNLLLQPQNP